MNRAEARQIMQKLGYGRDKRRPVTVSTRNLPGYRDPAVIMIDQFKEMYIDGQLEAVDTMQWYPKIMRKDFTVAQCQRERSTTPTSSSTRTTFARPSATTQDIAVQKSTSWSTSNRRNPTRRSARGAEHTGESLALLTWVVFGGIVVARLIGRVNWLALLYAVLSLTLDRMLLVFLCLIGTRTSTGDKVSIGWFGPRGLAAIVFEVLVLDEKLPGNDAIMLAAGSTVLLSVIAHGVSANPLVRRLADRSPAEAGIALPGEEEADVAGHSSRIFQHLSPEVEAERPQMIAPEFVAELGSTL
jgi:hypothetical protein